MMMDAHKHTYICYPSSSIACNRNEATYPDNADDGNTGYGIKTHEY